VRSRKTVKESAVPENRLKGKLSHFSWWRHRAVRLITYILLIDLAFVFLYPFLYMVITSLKTNQDLLDATVQWIPSSLHFQNYRLAFHALNLSSTAVTSLIYTVIGTIGHLLSCSFIGYGFARYRFPGKNVLFVFLMLMIIIPTPSLIAPMYITFSNLGWLNTYLPVLVPTFFGFGLRGGLFIFIFRQFFQSLPRELEDAARVDGCSHIGTFFRIVLPVSSPVFLVSFVLSLVWHWNDYYEPSIYYGRNPPLPVALNSMNELLTSPGKLANLISEMGIVDADAIINNAVFMAASFITVLPLLIVFIFVQRRFMQGIERTGLVE